MFVFVSFVYIFFFYLLNLDIFRENGAQYLAPYMSSLIPKKVLTATRNQHRKNSVVDNLGDAVFKNTPSAPLNLKAAIVATRFITLSWSMPSSPNGELSGYSVFYKEFGSDRYAIINELLIYCNSLNAWYFIIILIIF